MPDNNQSQQSQAKFLFICTGNSARSQMAEGLLRYLAGDHFQVYSAGVEPKGVNPYAIQAMDERGISLAGQSSDNLRQYLGHTHFGYVVTVCDHAEESCPRVWLQAQNHMHWAFEDPAAFEGTPEETLAKFREVRDQIEAKLMSWLAEQGIAVAV
ncbi:MAG: arsenate reductase ArsC [Anaerolineales bacterium]|nr:arsenate reductase ArsC [Anaerolineales bacterium]